jgi:capsule polysaccharide export protein KpsE/RkpR
MNFFKDEISQLGDKLESTVRQAGEGLEQVVLKASEELGKQRNLTKADMQELIEFATQEIGAALDVRLDKAKADLSNYTRRLLVVVGAALGVFMVLGLAVYAFIRWH